jgi:hypothetical protein
MFGCLLSVGAFPIASAHAGLVTSGLVLDLEAGKGVVMDGSGNVVSWADQSGQGHDATQANSASRPTFVSNGLNGGPSLRFGGTGSFLDVAGQVISSQQFTIMALVTDSGSATGYREIFSNWSNTSLTNSVFLGLTDHSPTQVRFSDDFDAVGSVSNPTNPFVLTGVSSASDAIVYQDALQLAAKGSALTTRILNDDYHIGTQDGFEFWNGDIAAILVYDRALSTVEIAQNVQYLYNPVAVPEPSTLVSLTIGILGVALLRHRRAATTPST